MTKTRTNKKGFTLVELSIVLVIIGLLIGGILVAQSMIGTAKVQALTRQIGQYDAAVANFQTKFNQLPGDNTLFAPTAGAVVDGTIRSAVPDIIAFTGEIGKFWADLAKSGLTNDSGTTFVANDVTATISTGAATGPNVPSAKAGTNANFLAYGVSGQNYYSIANHTGSTTIAAANAFKPADVLAVDTKLDDGISNKGVVQAMGNTLNVAPATTCATNNIDQTPAQASGTYAVTQTADQCVIRVRMGSTSGMYN